MTFAVSSPSGSRLAPHSAEKRRVALHSMIAAAAMTLLKLAAGLFSGSLGVLSDAAHSALDLTGSALTFFSVQVSDKPADEDHTYGHGKVENISSFGEVGLMAISCAWIIWEAIERIRHNTVELRHSVWPVLVLLTSIAVDFWRSRQLAATCQAHRFSGTGDGRIPFCQRHLVHLRGARRSWRQLDRERNFRVQWLRYADPFAAVVVSLMILRITARFTRETVAVLMDEVPAETRRQIVDEVERVDGVLAVEQARVRRAGATYFADLTLALAAAIYIRAHRRIGARSHRCGSSRAASGRRRHSHRSTPGTRRKHLRSRPRRRRAQQCQRPRISACSRTADASASSSMWNSTRPCRCSRRTTSSPPWRRRSCARRRRSIRS